jgi:hypothetical protein
MSSERRTLLAMRPRGTIGTIPRLLARVQAVVPGAGPGRTEGTEAHPSVTLWATQALPPRLTVVPFRRTPLVFLSVRGPAAHQAEVLAALEGLGEPLEAWEVETTEPVRRAPVAAACLLTFFRKRPGIDPGLFHHRWFEEHTPMTLRIHPVTGYVRNVVKEHLVVGSAPWDGIVTEDFAQHSHLVSLGVFGQGLFGRGGAAILNAVRVGRHVSSFLDLRTLETYLVHEVPWR